MPQHVNEAAAQAAKRIITTRMASDGKMIPLQTPTRVPHRTFSSRLAHVRGPAAASRALSPGLNEYSLNRRDRLTFGSRLEGSVISISSFMIALISINLIIILTIL